MAVVWTQRPQQASALLSKQGDVTRGPVDGSESVHPLRPLDLITNDGAAGTQDYKVGNQYYDVGHQVCQVPTSVYDVTGQGPVADDRNGDRHDTMISSFSSGSDQPKKQEQIVPMDERPEPVDDDRNGDRHDTMISSFSSGSDQPKEQEQMVPIEGWAMSAGELKNHKSILTAVSQIKPVWNCTSETVPQGVYLFVRSKDITTKLEVKKACEAILGLMVLAGALGVNAWKAFFPPAPPPASLPVEQRASLSKDEKKAERKLYGPHRFVAWYGKVLKLVNEWLERLAMVFGFNAVSCKELAAEACLGNVGRSRMLLHVQQLIQVGLGIIDPLPRTAGGNKDNGMLQSLFATGFNVMNDLAFDSALLPSPSSLKRQTRARGDTHIDAKALLKLWDTAGLAEQGVAEQGVDQATVRKFHLDQDAHLQQRLGHSKKKKGCDTEMKMEERFNGHSNQKKRSRCEKENMTNEKKSKDDDDERKSTSPEGDGHADGMPSALPSPVGDVGDDDGMPSTWPSPVGDVGDDDGMPSALPSPVGNVGHADGFGDDWPEWD